MRRFTALVVVAAGIWFFPNQLAHACGDKLLSLARAIRLYAAYSVWRSASILIYVGGSTGAKTVKDPQLQWSLKQVRHKVQTAENPSQLDQALSSRPFDLVLADISDAATLAQRVAPLRSKPWVLPVVYKPTKRELAAIEKQFHFVLKTPTNSTQHLETIDQAMKSRARASSGKL